LTKNAYRGGGNIAESFLPKNFGDIGTFGDIAPPFVLEAYVAGIFSPKKFSDIGKFGGIGPLL
jgi:hypothetical protein